MSALFPEDKEADIISAFRENRLVPMAGSLLGDDFNPSDDYILSKMRAAEADAERRLRCFFGPVTVFAYEPTQEDIDSVQDKRWVEESSYDYESHLWNTEDWGYLALRKTPTIELEKIIMAYPAPTQGFYEMPLDWCRLDKKAGQIRFVPTATAVNMGPLSSYLLSAMAGGRDIPGMIQIRYRAGLKNAAEDYPDLLDVVQKMAILRIIQDAFLPQSGSISADGLSQSLSVNVADYESTIDHKIGVLFYSIHGPQMTIF